MTSTTASGDVRRRVAPTVAILLVAAAALLVVGVLLERHGESGADPPTGATTGAQQESQHDESSEGAHAESGAPSAGADEVAERVAGISTESPWIVTLGSITSIALAVAVWLRPNRPVIVIVVAVTSAALVLDILEVSHQLGAGRTGLAALAGVIAGLRLATIAGSGYLFRTQPGVV